MANQQNQYKFLIQNYSGNQVIRDMSKKIIVKPLRHRKILIGLLAATSITFAFLWYIGVINDNFRVVTPEKCYRSGQMSYKEIRQTVSTYGIRTMINLKGIENEPWYTEEIKAAKDSGIRHVDIDLNPWKLPPPQELAKLLEAFQKDLYPIWIHCQAGSDRTGLACVIYRVVQEGVPLDKALNDQLTWRYGHWAYGNARPMDTFFELYRQTGRGKDLASWILQDYPLIYVEQ